MEEIHYREMTSDDFDTVISLMRSTQGVTVRQADSRESIARYLTRNPGMSFVAEKEGRIIGMVMCGHDGRRGYLHHLIVSENERNRGIATTLVKRALDRLEADGIQKTHIDVLKENDLGARFWERAGWARRDDILRFSFNRSDEPNV